MAQDANGIFSGSIGGSGALAGQVSINDSRRILKNPASSAGF